MKSWVIASKDLRLLFRDRRALTVLVLLPLIFITIIGLTTGKLLGWQKSNQILVIAAVDEVDYKKIEELDLASDGETETRLRELLPNIDKPEDERNWLFKEAQRTAMRNLVTKILNGLQEKPGIEIREIATEDEAKRLCEIEEVTAYLIIKPEFPEEVGSLRPRDLMHPDQGKLQGDLGNIGVYLGSREPDASTTVTIRNVVFSEVWKKLSPIVMCENNFLRGNRGVGIQGMCNDLDAESLAEPIKRQPANPNDGLENESIYKDVVPSYTVMFVFFLVNIMGRSFIHERDLGTLRRLRLAPLAGTSVLTGKTVPFLIVSLVQTLLLFVGGWVLALYDMRGLQGLLNSQNWVPALYDMWGSNPWLLLPVAFCTSMAATALGLLVSTIVRTEGQVSAYANTVVITMAGISGCFMPRKWLPEIMQTLSLATPHAWALMAYNEIMNHAVPNLLLVAKSCGWLIAFTLLYFTLGSWRFARAK